MYLKNDIEVNENLLISLALKRKKKGNGCENHKIYFEMEGEIHTFVVCLSDRLFRCCIIYGVKLEIGLFV